MGGPGSTGGASRPLSLPLPDRVRGAGPPRIRGGNEDPLRLRRRVDGSGGGGAFHQRELRPRGRPSDLGLPAEDARSEFDGLPPGCPRRAPDRHGWWPRGFLTAFVDEDELLATGGGVPLPGRRRGRAGRRAVAGGDPERAGHGSAHEYGSEKFGPAMQDLPSGPRPRARGRGAWALLGGCGTRRGRARDRLELADRQAPQAVQRRGHRGGRGAPPRRRREEVVDRERGALARSFRGPHACTSTDPYYREILTREQPDLVIGDVASLDLAMPAAMRREGALATPRSQLDPPAGAELRGLGGGADRPRSEPSGWWTAASRRSSSLEGPGAGPLSDGAAGVDPKRCARP